MKNLKILTLLLVCSLTLGVCAGCKKKEGNIQPTKTSRAVESEDLTDAEKFVKRFVELTKDNEHFNSSEWCDSIYFNELAYIDTNLLERVAQKRDLPILKSILDLEEPLSYSGDESVKVTDKNKKELIIQTRKNQDDEIKIVISDITINNFTICSPPGSKVLLNGEEIERYKQHPDNPGSMANVDTYCFPEILKFPVECEVITESFGSAKHQGAPTDNGIWTTTDFKGGFEKFQEEDIHSAMKDAMKLWNTLIEDIMDGKTSEDIAEHFAFQVSKDEINKIFEKSRDVAMFNSKIISIQSQDNAHPYISSSTSCIIPVVITVEQNSAKNNAESERISFEKKCLIEVFRHQETGKYSLGRLVDETLYEPIPIKKSN